MSVIKITTNFNIDLEFEAAPFHRRLLAWVLDLLVLFLYALVVMKLLDTLAHSIGGEGAWAIYMLLMIPFLTYHLFTELLMGGQSIGKKIMRIKVVTENGGMPGIGQYVIRWLIRTSDYMAIVIMILVSRASQTGDLNMIWKIGIPFGLLFADLILINTKRQQRLGDILAHTLVISATRRQKISDTVFLEVEEAYVPSFPQVMQLSDRDINSLKGILDVARKRHDYNLAEMASEKIKNHLKIQTSLSPYDFLQVLLKDYNYLSTNQ